MRYILFVLFLSISLGASCQDIPPMMRLSPSGFVGEDSAKYFVVIEVPDKSQYELYKMTLTYLNSLYKNPQKVISTTEGESIVVNGYNGSISTSSGMYNYKMSYQIIFRFRDGRIRYEPSITNLEEVFLYAEGKAKKYYLTNTESPNEVEINCIWLENKNGDGYFLFKDELKGEIDNWVNLRIIDFVDTIKNDDW